MVHSRRKRVAYAILISILILVLLVFYIQNIQNKFNNIAYKADRQDAHISSLEYEYGRMLVKLTSISNRVFSTDNELNLADGTNSGSGAIIDGYINPHNFKYRINTPRDICKNADFDIFIYVHSAPINFERRRALRHTWANKALLKRLNIGLVFVTGIVTNDSTVMDGIVEESDQYGDIVQTDYIDVYANLSLKAMSAVNWAAVYCAPFVPVIVKSDDDIYINITRLVTYVKNDMYNIVLRNGDRLILCNLQLRDVVVRDPKNRYYVSQDSYDRELYPPYCRGSAWILTTQAVVSLKDASFGVHLFPMDDVLITGFIAARAGVKRIAMNRQHLETADKDKSLTEKEMKSSFIFHHSSITNLLKLWDNMMTVNY